MTVLGWLLAYWGLWATLGSFIMMIRFPSWCEEWQLVAELSLKQRLSETCRFLSAITLWPREYRLQEFIELFSDDDDDDNQDQNHDDDEGDKPTPQRQKSG